MDSLEGEMKETVWIRRREEGAGFVGCRRWNSLTRPRAAMCEEGSQELSESG